MIDLGKKARVVVHEDEEDKRDHDGGIEDNYGFPPAGLDARRQEAGDEEPDQNPEKNKVPYEEPEGHEVEHSKKAVSRRLVLFTRKRVHSRLG